MKLVLESKGFGKLKTNTLSSINLGYGKNLIRLMATAMCFNSAMIPNNFPKTKGFEQDCKDNRVHDKLQSNVVTLISFVENLDINESEPGRRYIVLPRKIMTLTVESACTLRKTVTDSVFNHGACCSWKAYHADTQRVFVNQFAGYTQLLTALFVTKKSQLKNAENLEKDTSAHKMKRIVFYGGKWKFLQIP